MKLQVLLVLALILTGCGGGGKNSGGSSPPASGTYVYSTPAASNDGWRTAAASDEDVAVTELEAMMNSIRQGNYEYLDSIVIARAGKLIFEETIRVSVDAEDGRVGNVDPRMHAQFSATKSITALAVGIAIDEGHIASVDSPYLSLFSYPGYANWDDRKAQITLADVLAMRSGLDWNEWDPPYSSANNRLNRFYAEEVDYAKAFLDLPMANDPGTWFGYNTAATVSLAQAIENVSPLSFVDFGLSELLGPLNISNVEFLTTPTGLPNAGGGFYFLTRDMAKFGQLVLDGGVWNAETVVSELWTEEVVNSRTAISWPNPDAWDWQLDGYGYHWWLGFYELDARRIDTWVMWGFGGQWVVVVPEFELVIAINSHGYDNSDAALNQAHELIRTYILPAAR